MSAVLLYVELDDKNVLAICNFGLAATFFILREGYTSSQPSYNYSKADLDNKSNQLNPNNPTYYSSRGTSKK